MISSEQAPKGYLRSFIKNVAQFQELNSTERIKL